MSSWSFYDPASGVFAGYDFSGPDQQVLANTPAGYASILGRFDHLSQRVDVSATPPAQPKLDAQGQPVPWYPPVIDYQPPAPANDAMQTWAWHAGIKRWLSQPTLASLKLARWSAIKAAREAAEYSPFAWDGSSFDADSESQRRIQGAAQLAMIAAAAQQAFSIDWTLADNTVRTLSGTEMIGVGLALGTHVATQHVIARGLRAEIEDATTSQQLEAINWPNMP